MTASNLTPFGDELVLIVMGPGKGESVLVRWPPDRWLVVDSFRRSTRKVETHPVVEFLDDLGERVDAVALTHPHDDHTAGFSTLIDRRKVDGLVGWWPADVAGSRWSSPNGSAAERSGTNEHAIAAIERTWREEPASRWELRGGADPLVIGDATIRVLTPLSEAIDHCQTAKSPDYNEMSSALLLEWGACRLLLGGDLVNRRGWDSVHSEHGEFAFADTVGMKVAHHGSKEAQHPVALGEPPPTHRTYLAAPYNRGKKVPDFADDEDVDLLLRLMHTLLVSSHHGPTPPNAGVVDTPRTVLRSATLAAGPLAIDIDAPRPRIQDCWVAARWTRDGVLASTARGPGSIAVVA